MSKTKLEGLMSDLDTAVFAVADNGPNYVPTLNTYGLAKLGIRDYICELEEKAFRLEGHNNTLAHRCEYFKQQLEKIKQAISEYGSPF